MVLQTNRDEPKFLEVLGDKIVGLILGELERPGSKLSLAIRYHMILCVVRLDKKLDIARVCWKVSWPRNG